MQYLWNKDMKKPEFPTLKGNRETDVLIIGGGIVGILCALKLKQKGINYLLVEANTIGSGITKATTAVLTAQHDILYQDIEKKYGQRIAKLYLESNLNSLDQFKNLALSTNCDFEQKPSIMYSINDKKIMQNEVKCLNKLGYKAVFEDKIPLPFSVAGAVVFPNMAQFHPLKFLYGVSEKLNILEKTFINKISNNIAYSENGTIKANKIIIATHFPFINKHGMYFIKLYQKRSYVIAYDNAPNIGCTIQDIAENGIYIRNYNNLLLVGGGDHRTGTQGRAYDYIRYFVYKYFPDLHEVYCWSNQDCISLDGISYIGRYSPSFKNVFVASGFNLWGMTTAMTASDILTDMVIGNKNKYQDVFLPNRSMISSQLFTNIGNTLVDYLIPTNKRCSHMGCALKWNPLEHSWDCPCHGSRFDKKGNIIDNPAIKKINVK